ncbi:hypothetical protein Tco_0140522 [Tanacetum coccineum]
MNRELDIALGISTASTSVSTGSRVSIVSSKLARKIYSDWDLQVAFNDVEDSSRPARSVLTLKPLPTIDPKDKGKSVLEEPEPAKKMTRSDFDDAQIARDEEVARQLEVELQAKVERERQREEQASMDYIADLYDEVQAAAQRKFRAAQRAAEIRSRPPTKSQLRNLMMTYLNNMGDDAVKDSKEAAGKDTSKKEQSFEENERSKKDAVESDSDLEEEEHLKTFLNIVPDEEEEVDYEVLDKRYLIVDWESKFYHTDRYGEPHDYYRIFRADGSSRYIKTFTEMVSRFDRLDFIELHSLVMQRFETTPEGIDLVLWGDLRTMFEENADDNLWKNQEFLRYPLTKETLERMMSLKLIAESASDGAYNLIRFIQKHIDEFGSHDGNEKDL